MILSDGYFPAFTSGMPSGPEGMARPFTPAPFRSGMHGMIPRWLRGMLLAAALLPGHRAAAYDGRMVDSVTGVPISGGMAILGNQQVVTDTSGRFHLDGTAGSVFLRAPGYRAATVAATSGNTTPDIVIQRLDPFTPRALYLTVYGIGSDVLRGAALNLIRDGGANALVIDVKGDRGLVPYPSGIALVNAGGARQLTTIPDLPALVRTLHARGIYLIARIVTFKDQPLATLRPDLAVRGAGGGVFHDREGLSWTDPLRPEVRRYNIAIAIEAARAGFDEIQFDYLRFPDSPQHLGFSGPAGPDERVAAISGFLGEARQALRPWNVYLAADIFGYVCWNRDDSGIGQRLDSIARNVDYLSPMLYPSGFQFGIPGYRDPVSHPYEIVHQSLEIARARLGVSPKRFRPWLQAFRDYAFDHRAFEATEVKAQISAATDFGSDGWMLWNPGNRYDGAGLAAAGRDGKEVQVASTSDTLSCY